MNHIASDLHNGNRVSDYDKVMAFLDLVEEDADEFIMLGDWEELIWSNMNIITTVKPYCYVNQKVKTIAQKKPTKSIIGNQCYLGICRFVNRLVKLVGRCPNFGREKAQDEAYR